METKTTKCTACGAPVLIDGSSRNVTCRYCGTAIVVADFEEIKVAEVAANTQIAQERLNQRAADRKLERIKQLEADLHAAESLLEETQKRGRIFGFVCCGCFVLMFIVSWHFLWIGMLVGFAALLSGLGTAGQKAKVLVIRQQIDSLIK